MRAHGLPPWAPTILYTFSKRNPFGDSASSILAYCRKRFPRWSSVPFTPAALAPAAENVWQGGPPITKSMSFCFGKYAFQNPGRASLDWSWNSVLVRGIHVSGTQVCTRIGPKSNLGHPSKKKLKVCLTFAGLTNFLIYPLLIPLGAPMDPRVPIRNLAPARDTPWDWPIATMQHRRQIHNILNWTHMHCEKRP